MFSDVLFCLTNTPKTKDIQFTVIKNMQMKKIITSEKLEPEFLLKNY